MPRPLLRKLPLGGIIHRLLCVVHLGFILNPLSPHKKGDFARFHLLTQGRNSDSDFQYPELVTTFQNDFAFAP